MKVNLRFFSYLVKFAKVETLDYEVPPGTLVRELIQRVQSDFPDLAQYIPHSTVTVNQQVVNHETVLSENDEVALLPALRGG